MEHDGSARPLGGEGETVGDIVGAIHSGIKTGSNFEPRDARGDTHDKYLKKTFGDYPGTTCA